MVKLIVGGADEGSFEELPAMRDVEISLNSAVFLAKDDKFADRIQFDFEVTGGDDAEDTNSIGKPHTVWANMPQGKTGKLSPRSTLYQLLEGMSGGEFNPDDELDTDEYVGRKYVADFKRVQKQKNVGTQEKPVFAPAFADDGTPLKKTQLTIRGPVRARRRKAQEEFDWENDETA